MAEHRLGDRPEEKPAEAAATVSRQAFELARIVIAIASTLRARLRS